MDEGWPRPGAKTEYRRDQPPIMRHPDRIALWAVVIAVVGMIAAAASAHGASGGAPAGDSRALHLNATDDSAAPINK